MASARNAEHIASGRARFVCTTLEEADFGDARFDKVFGIHFPPICGTTQKARVASSNGCSRRAAALGSSRTWPKEAPRPVDESARTRDISHRL